jgi:hypothetical protein
VSRKAATLELIEKELLVEIQDPEEDREHDSDVLVSDEDSDDGGMIDQRREELLAEIGALKLVEYRARAKAASVKIGGLTRKKGNECLVEAELENDSEVLSEEDDKTADIAERRQEVLAEIESLKLSDFRARAKALGVKVGCIKRKEGNERLVEALLQGAEEDAEHDLEVLSSDTEEEQFTDKHLKDSTSKKPKKTNMMADWKLVMDARKR